MVNATRTTTEILNTLPAVLPSVLEPSLPVLLPPTALSQPGLVPHPTIIIIVVPVLLTAAPPAPPPPAPPPPRRLTLSGDPDRRFLTGINRTERQQIGDSRGSLTRKACDCQ